MYSSLNHFVWIFIPIQNLICTLLFTHSCTNLVFTSELFDLLYSSPLQVKKLPVGPAPTHASPQVWLPPLLNLRLGCVLGSRGVSPLPLLGTFGESVNVPLEWAWVLQPGIPPGIPHGSLHVRLGGFLPDRFHHPSGDMNYKGKTFRTFDGLRNQDLHS